MIPVTVQDRNRRPIDGLKVEDFVLLDNEQPRRLESETVYHPIALVCLVQSSANSAAALTKIRPAGALVGHLITGDRGLAALVAYGASPAILQPLMRSQATLAQSFRDIRAGGGSARLHDGVVSGARLLAEAPRSHRKVMLIIGERRDRGSETRLEEALSLVQRDNIAVYGITYSPSLSQFAVKQQEAAPASGMNLSVLFSHLRQTGKADSLRALTHYTGGRVLGFLSQKAIEQALTTIGEELHSQYLLSFVPPVESQTEYHSIQVRVVSRPDAQVRSRPAYWMSER